VQQLAILLRGVDMVPELDERPVLDRRRQRRPERRRIK
jgi:hypothetical protein